MKLLNPGYETNSITVTIDGTPTDILVNNSLYWNRTSGETNYFSGQSDAYTTVTAANNTFSTIGITSATKARNLIDEKIWNIGSIGAGTTAYANQLYLNERLTSSIATPSDDVIRQRTWTGKVGLMYPSDYGYATDFSLCDLTVPNYNAAGDNNNYPCRSNNWLYKGINEWTLSLYISSDYNHRVWYINASGYMTNPSAYTNHNVRPVLFLDSDVYFWIGEGTSSNPYQIR